jgi:cell wall-associated NlpC family hydrolase
MPSAVTKRKTDKAPAKPVRAASLGDVLVTEFILDGRPMDANVVNALIDVSLGRHIDGASEITATLSDPGLKLLNSPIFAKAIDLWIADLPFRLADLSLTDDDGAAGLSLEFEPRAIAKLRASNTPMHASRADKTRAEFIKALCDKAGVEFVCPQLHKTQEIQSVEDAKTPAERKRDRNPGLTKNVDIKVKGQRADSEQVDQIDRAMSVAHSLSAPTLAQLAMDCAGIGESGFRAVPNAGGSNYWGVFQGSKGTFRIGDTEGMAHSFLKGGKGFQGGGAIALAEAHPDMSPGEIATRVEGSGQPASFYDAYRDEATEILKAFGTTADDVSSPVRDEYAVAYMFRTLPAEETQDNLDEDYWTCVRRLADEVNWRLWEEADTVYFMTDADIMKSEVQVTITPGAQGINSVTGQVSTRRPDQEVVVECDARRWQAGPATVCELVGYGPRPTSSHTMTLSGRWLVASIERQSLFATDTTITLHRRQKAKLEPAHSVATRTASGATVSSSGVDLTGGALTGSTRAKVVAAATKAAKLSAADPTYYWYSQSGSWKHDVWARDQRGVGPQGLPGGTSNRSDCSTFVIQCFEKAGCVLPASMKGAGFTGTLADEGTKTTRPQPGDVCLYGSGPPYRHVELFIGDGKTIGHGDAKVDYSTPNGPSGFAGYWTFGFLDDDASPALPSGPANK